MPQTIVVVGGRVVSVDIGVLPPDAVERVVNALNNTFDNSLDNSLDNTLNSGR